MAALTFFVDLFLNLDTVLAAWVGTYGGWVYLMLFLIIFCETGLVVMAVLPGDSLLFTAGALAAIVGANVRMNGKNRASEMVLPPCLVKNAFVSSMYLGLITRENLPESRMR